MYNVPQELIGSWYFWFKRKNFIKKIRGLYLFMVDTECDTGSLLNSNNKEISN